MAINRVAINRGERDISRNDATLGLASAVCARMAARRTSVSGPSAAPSYNRSPINQPTFWETAFLRRHIIFCLTAPRELLDLVR